MKKIYHWLLINVCILILSDCAVHKAASNEGVAVSDINECKTRDCFLSHGMKVLDRRKEKSGKYVEVYRAVARKSGLNYARAVGHGVLDVMTFGLWEVAGTPIEGAISNNRGYIIARATYISENSDTVEKVKIYNTNNEKVS